MELNGMNLLQAAELLRQQIKENPQPERVYNCPICKDTGTVEKIINGVSYEVECDCQAEQRRRITTARHIKNSGLGELLESMTFDNYQTPTDAHRHFKAKALKNCTNNDWWFMGGKVGTGKTHLATAICGEMIKSGYQVRYMQYKKDMAKLKNLKVADFSEYEEFYKRFSTAQVLYIDDLFKGKTTETDIDIIFELINDRNINNLKTLITTEMQIDEIMTLEHDTGGAIGSRIIQKCNGCIFSIQNIDNYRIVGGAS